MSSQRGNTNKKGPQKHQNKHAFKNTLHDTNKRSHMLNDIQLDGLCARCKEVIAWKIKYKKYKLLTIAKKCVKCQQKAVKKAYYIVCDPCAVREKICAKCGQKKDIVLQPGLSSSEEAARQSELKGELGMMTERQRRTFYRSQASGKLQHSAAAAGPTGKTEEGKSEEDDSELSDSEEEDNKDLPSEKTLTQEESANLAGLVLDDPAGEDEGASGNHGDSRTVEIQDKVKDSVESENVVTEEEEQCTS